MIAVRLRSDDSAAQRAANLLELCGLTRGDPAEVKVTLAKLEEGLAAYMEIDRKAKR